MRGNILRVVLVLGFCLFAGIAMAKGGKSAAKGVEASMRVKGMIHINPDGGVDDIELGHAGDLDASLEGFIRHTVMAWRFEPIMEHGVAVQAKAPLAMRLTATEADDGDFRASISSVSFQTYDPHDETRLRSDQIRKPRYPNKVARAGVMGDVYVVVKVGRDGRVEDAMVHMVNLRTSGPQRSMDSWRTQLGQASLQAVRDWTFKLPTQGSEVDEPYWLLTVPVTFRIEGTAHPRDGIWTVYVPGPREPIPWLKPDTLRSAMSPDALADGGVYMIGDNRGPTLLTPLDPG